MNSGLLLLATPSDKARSTCPSPSKRTRPACESPALRARRRKRAKQVKCGPTGQMGVQRGLLSDWQACQSGGFRSSLAGIRTMTLLCLCCWELVCTCSFHWLRGNLAALRIPTADAAAEADLEWNFPPVPRLGPGANGRSENLSRTQEGDWEEGWEDSQRGRGREARSGH